MSMIRQFKNHVAFQVANGPQLNNFLWRPLWESQAEWVVFINPRWRLKIKPHQLLSLCDKGEFVVPRTNSGAGYWLDRDTVAQRGDILMHDHWLDVDITDTGRWAENFYREDVAKSYGIRVANAEEQRCQIDFFVGKAGIEVKYSGHPDRIFVQVYETQRWEGGRHGTQEKQQPGPA